MNGKLGLFLGGLVLALGAFLTLRRTQTTPAGSVTFEPLIPNADPNAACPEGTQWNPITRNCLPVVSPLPPFGSPGTTPSNPVPVFQPNTLTVAGETVFDPSTALVI